MVNVCGLRKLTLMGVFKAYGKAFRRISILMLAPQVPKKIFRKGLFPIREL